MTNTYPIQSSQRIEALDIARGIALFGILMVNMSFFSYPVLYADFLETPLWEGSSNQFAQSIIYLFFEANFFTLFSLLFGIGFMIFMEKAEQKGHAVRSLYVRRLGVLLVFGLIHLFFIWFGDILTIYAIIGFFLLIFRRRSPKTILRWACALVLLPVVLIMLMASSFIATEGDIEGDMYLEEMITELQSQFDSSMLVFSEGSYAQMFEQRLIDIAFMVQGMMFMAPIVLAMFLFGMYVWKKRMLQDFPQTLPMVRKIWWSSLVIGLFFGSIAMSSHLAMESANSPYYFISYGATLVKGPALALFYFTSIVLLLRKDFWQLILSIFQPLGRMALTNYIMQSLICTFIFYSYGLGLYGKMNPTMGMIMTLAIITAQIVMSKFWFKKFRFGPLEWLWRYCIYGFKN